MHKLNKLVASASTLLLTLPVTAFAATAEEIQRDLDAAGGAAFGQGAVGGANSLPVIIGNMISAALGLLGVVMVVLIIYAGFLYLTAAGDDKKVDTAKAIIKNAIIGAVLIFTAYAITSFVVGAITGAAGSGA